MTGSHHRDTGPPSCARLRDEMEQDGQLDIGSTGKVDGGAQSHGFLLHSVVDPSQTFTPRHGVRGEKLPVPLGAAPKTRSASRTCRLESRLVPERARESCRALTCMRGASQAGDRHCVAGGSCAAGRRPELRSGQARSRRGSRDRRLSGAVPGWPRGLLRHGDPC